MPDYQWIIQMSCHFPNITEQIIEQTHGNGVWIFAMPANHHFHRKCYILDMSFNSHWWGNALFPRHVVTFSRLFYGCPVLNDMQCVFFSGLTHHTLFAFRICVYLLRQVLEPFYTFYTLIIHQVLLWQKYILPPEHLVYNVWDVIFPITSMEIRPFYRVRVIAQLT